MSALIAAWPAVTARVTVYEAEENRLDQLPTVLELNVLGCGGAEVRIVEALQNRPRAVVVGYRGHERAGIRSPPNARRAGTPSRPA